MLATHLQCLQQQCWLVFALQGDEEAQLYEYFCSLLHMLMRKVKEIMIITVGMNVCEFARQTELSSSWCFTLDEMLGIWQPWCFQCACQLHLPIQEGLSNTQHLWSALCLSNKVNCMAHVLETLHCSRVPVEFSNSLYSNDLSHGPD